MDFIRKDEYEVPFRDGPLITPLGHQGALPPDHIVDVLEGMSVEDGVASRLYRKYPKGEVGGSIILSNGDLLVRVLGTLPNPLVPSPPRPD